MRGLVHDESAYCLGGQAGNAGLFVCLDDVFLSASLLLQGGYANGKQFFLESSLAKLMTNKTEGLEERRSLGFRLHDSSTFEGPLWPSSSFGHTGFTGTSLAISPEQRMVSVILSNRVYYGRAETAQKMSDFRIRFHGEAFREFCR
jgi:CubicO group peptidase (beta-lactamase class C family)